MSKILFPLLSCLMIASCATTNKKAIEHYERGVRQNEKGDYEAAIALWQRALSLQPSFAAAHVAMGTAHYNRRQYEKARLAYEKAIAIKPSPQAYIGLGHIYWYHDSNTIKALSEYRRALELAPNDAGANYYAGKALSVFGAYDEAIETLERAVELEPTSPHPHENLAISYLATGQSGKAKSQWKLLMEKGGFPTALLELNRNMLQTVAADGILFVNGDDDTFPAWYLQKVEGFRSDVQVVNLSLLEGREWYMKHLRDRGLGMLTFMETFNSLAWKEARVPWQFEALGLDIEVSPLPDLDVMGFAQRQLLEILHQNAWRRPVYFANTVESKHISALEPYLRNEGLAARLVPDRGQGVDHERIKDNLLDVYEYAEAKAFEATGGDVDLWRLLGNYQASLLQLTERYYEEGDIEEAVGVSQWAVETMPLRWSGYYRLGRLLEGNDRLQLAAGYLERSGYALAKEYGLFAEANYENLLALASMLLNAPYGAPERAERVYRLAVEKEPDRANGYYELAASLQAKGDVPAALELLRDFRETHGEVEQLIEAERILEKVLKK